MVLRKKKIETTTSWKLVTPIFIVFFICEIACLEDNITPLPSQHLLPITTTGTNTDHGMGNLDQRGNFAGVPLISATEPSLLTTIIMLTSTPSSPITSSFASVPDPPSSPPLSSQSGHSHSEDALPAEEQQNNSGAVIDVQQPSATTVQQPQTPLLTCFYAEPEYCHKNMFYKKGSQSSSNDEDSSFNNIGPSPCQCVEHPTISDSWICCNITDISMITSCAPKPSRDQLNGTSWLNVHIRNATLKELDISHNIWKLLRSLSVTDGNIKKITNEFTKFSMPKCLNISNNNLTEIYPRAFTNLTQLQILDISHNNLSRIPNLSVQTNLTVDIRGNDGMLCSSVLESIERSAVKFIEPDITFCLMNQTFNWFNSTDRVPLSQLERMKQVKAECPIIPGHGNCTCDLDQIYQVNDNNPTLTFAAIVDCSGLGLTDLPEKLPPYTLALNVSNNNITSFGNYFHINPSYFKILRFYADNNRITSITELEGAKFIEVFESFYLRHNDIDKIPEYLLSNALDNNPSGRALYLGGNRLICDCNSAKGLKLWLLTRHNNIPDYNQILCENMPQRVVELNENKLCQSPHDWTDYIYYLIAAEIFMLVALILKVSYDYWVFKTSGYLPWPASKMPKLPCDWLCES